MRAPRSGVSGVISGWTLGCGVHFRITTPTVDFYVDVRLTSFGGRWLAVAEIAGELGLGWSAKEALATSLSCLGPAAVAALVADPQLFAIIIRE